MIPDFFQTYEPVSQFGVFKTLIGLLILVFGTFVGVEITLGKDDDEL